MVRYHRVFGAIALACAAPAAAQSIAAPGQSRADFRLWLATVPNADAATRFERYLRKSGVNGVVPLHQLLRTSSSWQACRGSPFSVAPPAAWPKVARTLQLLRDEVAPAIGDVEALSGYRDPALNRCSGGAPASAHAVFSALDLSPRSAMSRERMIARLCKLHARVGARWNWGLGFYSGMRFHIDTKGYRRWGSNGSGATSPCVEYDLTTPRRAG